MTSQGNPFAAPGSALAAYRSAMARVKPDEAFLARTKQAIEAGAAGARPDERAENAADTSSAPRLRFLQRRPGFNRHGMRRLALLAACLGLAALSLLAVPAAYLLTYRAGFSGGAPETAYQMMDEAGGQVGAVQSSPAAAAFEDALAGAPENAPTAGDAPADAPAGAEGEPQTPDAAPQEGGLEYREDPSNAYSEAKAAKTPGGKHIPG